MPFIATVHAFALSCLLLLLIVLIMMIMINMARTIILRLSIITIMLMAAIRNIINDD